MPNRVTRLREELGLTQSETALLLGISRSHLAMMETGKAAPADLAEIYLIQAERLCFMAQQEWEKVESDPLQPSAAWIKKKIKVLEIQQFRKQRELEDLTNRLRKKFLLAHFIKLLRLEPSLAHRKIESQLLLMERKYAISDSSELQIKLQELNLELGLIEKELDYWKSIKNN